MFADELAWELKDSTESDLADLQIDVLNKYYQILGNHDPYFNSDLAEQEIHRLVGLIERILGDNLPLAGSAGC